MYMRIEIHNAIFSSTSPYQLRIADPTIDRRDDGTLILATMSESQLIGLRDGINEFLRIKAYIPNTGSVFQQEIGK